MDKSDDIKLKEAMLSHYTEAEFIAKNFEKMKIDFANQIRKEIMVQLKERLNGKYIISEGNQVTKEYSQIWIKPTKLPDSSLFFGFESFSINNHKDKPYFIGIYNSKSADADIIVSENLHKHNPYWFNIEKIKAVDESVINNQHPKTLQKLHVDESFKKDFFENIIKQILAYLEKQTPIIMEFYENHSK